LGIHLQRPSDFEKHDFLSLYTKEKNARARVRLLGLHHIQSGKTLTNIGKILEVRRQTVGDWYKNFLERGFSGLYDMPKTGSNTILPREQEVCFQESVLKLQNERAGGRITINEIHQLLINKFHVQYKKRSVYELLKRLDLVWISSRSKHPNSDKKAQHTFKKTLLKK